MGTLFGAGPAVAASAPAAIGSRPYRELVDDFERGLISAALAQSEGNVAAAARLLQVDRGNLYRRMKALGVQGGEG